MATPSATGDDGNSREDAELGVEAPITTPAAADDVVDDEEKMQMQPLIVKVPDPGLVEYQQNMQQDWYRVKKCFCFGGDGGGFLPFQKMMTDEKIAKASIWALRFGVFIDAVNAAILNPNFPIMVTPAADGGTEESFESTAPFGFSAATYFIPFCSLFGSALAALVIGRVSDKVGRKPCILVCLYGSVGGQILRYFLRFNFWAFCAASFVNGLVSASCPLGLAYLGDISRNPKEKEQEFGVLVAGYMLGNSGGGIVAILMESTGLFAPLWVGAGTLVIAAVYCTFVLVESKQLLEIKDRISKMNKNENDPKDMQGDDDDFVPPTTVDKTSLWLILGGAVADNIGSTGLAPLCLSPLLFNAYYRGFVEKGLEPIMSQVAYKWISVIVGLTVIPGTMISPPIYGKIGAAGGCVVGNIITGITTIILLIIGSQEPSNALFGVFIAVLYVGFPFTVLSQLSTGPMLDVIAPPDKRGSIQGLNSMAMNIAMAVSPWVFGILADVLGTAASIWMCIGVSFAAALINLPLMWKKGLGPPGKKISKATKPLTFEDKELVEQILKGEWVDPAALDEINEIRRKRGQPYLVISPGKFEDDKDRLPQLRKQAAEDYLYRMSNIESSLQGINAADDIPGICKSVNLSLSSADPQDRKKAEEEMGAWFVEWLKYSGYLFHGNPQQFKQVIMSSFPVLSRDPEFTPDNIEPWLLEYTRFIRAANSSSNGESFGDQVRGVLSLRGSRGAVRV